MKTYSFAVSGLVGLHVEVEADSVEDAIEQAQSMGAQSICHHCSSANHQVDVWKLSDGISAEPGGCELEDVTIEGEELSDADREAIIAKWNENT